MSKDEARIDVRWCGACRDWHPKMSVCPQEKMTAPLPQHELRFTSPEITEEQVNATVELANWWLNAARIEVEKTVPKAIEYGSGDLEAIGRVLAKTAGREVTKAEAVELGIYFYILGKMSRWTDAVENNRKVSDDTLFDLGIYVKMALRTREVGGWPHG